MDSFLNLSLFGVALFIIGSHGVPIKKDNCTVSDAYLMLSCGMRAKDFGEKIPNLDIEDKDEMKEFKRGCDAINQCISTLGHCALFQDEEIKTGFALISNACSIINFFAGEFKVCDDKLDNRNLTCYEEWNPFQNDQYLSIDAKSAEACKDFFGVGNCLKKEVTESCGNKEWEKLRDHMLGINAEVKKCDFKGIV